MLILELHQSFRLIESKLFYVPTVARFADAVKLIAELEGEVIVVDELSLIRTGPVTCEGVE